MPTSEPLPVYADDDDSRDARASDPENLELVEKIARMVFRGRKGRLGAAVDLDDLIGYGRIGLVRAAEAFDPTRGIRFNTYATYWIRQAIGRALEDCTHPIRVPPWAQHAVLVYEADLRRDPRAIPPGKEESSRELVRSARRVLRAEVGHASSDRLEACPALWVGPGDEAVSDAEAWDLVSVAMDRLPLRMRSVLERRYRPADGEPRDVVTIAREDRVTRQAIRQLHEQGVDLLRIRLARSLALDVDGAGRDETETMTRNRGPCI